MRVASRHLTRNGALRQASRLQTMPQGRSSGWGRLHYRVVRGFLHYRVERNG